MPETMGAGVAMFDYDGDGDQDLIATSNNGVPRLLRNDLGEADWLRVRLRGLPPNTDAVGARILLYGARTVQQRMVRTGGSYLSQSELTQTFGLPPGEPVRRLEVRWPDGAACAVDHPPVRRRLDLVHPKIPGSLCR